jgi:hypothetical protein
MSYTDPLIVEVGETTYNYSRIFSNSKDSKYLDVDSVIGTREQTIQIRHSSGPVRKNSAKRTEVHNVLLLDKEWDATALEFDGIKSSFTLSTVSGSTVLNRAQINASIDRVIAVLSDTEFVDRLLRNET